MKKLNLLFLTLFCSVTLIAQRSNLSQLAIIQQDGNWIKMLADSRVETNRFFADFLPDLGLDENYHFELIDKQFDKLGFVHYRYQEYFNGHPVEGAIYILHEKDGFVSHANGKIIRGIPESSQVSISPDEGLTLAKESMDSQTFYYEMPGMEDLIKRIKKDANATFYPVAELVYAQALFAPDGKQYNLAYKYELYGANPEQKQTVFVDAGSGNKLFSLEGCHDGSAEGVAETRYHGTRTIITDSISATEYRLRDTTRGDGIMTYDLNEGIDVSTAVDFLDEDNIWDNANEEMDDAATDTHWGAEMFYDYFLNIHDRNSFDDEGGALISYVHFDAGWFNASNNGLWTQFGDGQGNPLTSVDIVGHEFTHALTGSSAGLIYQDESGALNESFSDIFGTMVEFYTLGSEANWTIGKANFKSRRMSYPNLYGDPDTYEGLYWYSGTEDNGGVHINSGVQNFWFYLLSEGGSGGNDNSNAYSIDSLGMEIAAAIAYRNLTVYLTPSSNYMDARYGAIQSAEDLYGICSDIALEVAEAWYAVGVGTESITPDLQVAEVLSPINSGCDLSAEEQISMAVRFNPTGCDLTIESGEEIEVSYQLNDEDPVVEIFVTTETINAGDVFNYDFQTPANLSASGQYLIDYTVNFSGDFTPSNDQISNYKITNAVTFEDDNVLSFEDVDAVDSIYVDLGDQAVGKISNLAENTGNYGFMMHSFGVTLENANIIASEDENFTANPDFTSMMCICVNLPDWDEAYLNFDLRQTYSPYYLDVLSANLSYMIALRITVNGQQIGEQFHPQTNESDPYATHVMDMSAYAGTEFTVCFESTNFLNSDEDLEGIGDKALLDNIFFSQYDATGINEIPHNGLEVYPNPSSGLLNIVSDQQGLHDVRIVDLMGRTVQKDRFMVFGSSYVLDVSSLAKGIYVMTIQADGIDTVKKIIIE